MIRKALVAMFCIVCSVLLSQDVTVMAQDGAGICYGRLITGCCEGKRSVCGMR